MLALSYVLTYVGAWLQRRTAAMQFFRLVCGTARTASVMVRHQSGLQLGAALKRTGAVEAQSSLRTFDRYFRCMSKDESYRGALLLEENGCEVLSITPQIRLSLTGWSFYSESESGSKESTSDRRINDGHTQERPETASNIDRQFVLLELENEDKLSGDLATLRDIFTCRSSHRENSLMLEDIVVPIAWKLDYIIAECVTSDLPRLYRLFIDGSLSSCSANGKLVVHTITSINIDVETTPDICSSPVSHHQSLLHMNSPVTTNHMSILNSNQSESPKQNKLTESAVCRGSTEDNSIKFELNEDMIHDEEELSEKFSDSDCAGEAPAERPTEELVSLSSHPDVGDVFPRRQKFKGGTGKPPNVVIYCGKTDSRRLFEKVRDTIALCLNPDRYAIYHLKHEQVHTTPWADNAALLVVSSDKAYDGADVAFTDYFVGGGTLISFACGALDTRFVRRIDKNSKTGLTLMNYRTWDSVAVICGRHVYAAPSSGGPGGVDTGDLGMIQLDKVTLTVLAEETNSGCPVIIEAIHKASGGLAILSQVNLDKDSSEMAISSDIFTLLKRSNTARFEILTNLFSNIGLDCDRPVVPALTPLYLLATNQKIKSQFINSVQPRLKNSRLISKDVTLHFCRHDDVQSNVVAGNVIPLITDVSVDDDDAVSVGGFDFVTYRRSLQTSVLGNTMMFSEIVTTTMTLFDGLMFSTPDNVGLVAVARRQTHGRGRGGNVWLSPEGCAMFSLHVRVPLDSLLGARVSYIQHIAALSVVLAVRHKPGYEALDIRIKWPNDIYFGSAVKLGGVIVKSSVMSDVIHANIGCGVNVTNKDPTICVNDLIRQHNNSAGGSSEGAVNQLSLFTVEELLGRTITATERLIDVFQTDGLDAFLKLYYTYWLHTDATVRLNSEDGPVGKIIGLDNYGYLSVALPGGSTVTVQPDGNSFDMMRNLIAPKLM